MPPQFASILCALLILFLFWADVRNKINGVSMATWIPLIWMFLAGSRYVSQWLNLSGPMTEDEGNPVNAASFSLLIAAGVFTLFRRQIAWSRLLTKNKWVWLYLAYCGISIIWSDGPFVTFKRYLKEIGNVVMVLVILTEERPYEAIRVVLRRLAFLLLPLSVLFIKYYPNLGRDYTRQGGQMFTGVGLQKNSLGLICLITGIYFFWNFLLKRKEGFRLTRGDSIVDLILLGMVVWLLHMSQSATSLACLVVAVSLFFIGRTTVMTQMRGRIIVVLLVVASLFAVLDAALDVRNVIYDLLERDSTLTTRVDIWKAVKGVATNPLVGTGYMNFWSGERLRIVSEKLGITIVQGQAHNGYLEQYLNLGLIGVAFIGVIVLSGLLRVRRYLYVDYPSAMLRLSFIVTAVLYNYTEASFYGLNFLWMLVLFSIIDPPSG